jgi:hypothetical protein
VSAGTGSQFVPAETGPVVVSPKDERRRIATVKEWLDWAGPLRGKRQWADGRSAKEVAKAWCKSDGRISVPAELQALLDSNAALGSLRIATVIPEFPTALGDVPRGARRHDLVLLGADRQDRPTLVGVEAKADEPFDALVSARLRRAQATATLAREEGRSDRSAQIPRIEWFSRALLGRAVFRSDGLVDAEVGALPYQLLAGLAGTLIEAAARGAVQAVFVVHAFHSTALDPVRVAANDAGFARFVEALPGGRGLVVRYGQLHGPLKVPGGAGIAPLPVYVGIAATQLAG